jgi:MFS family permease
MTDHDAPAVPDRATGTAEGHPVRVVSASLLGTAIEWYEFFIYGTAAALVFPKVFFPDNDPRVGALLSLSTFAVAFLARPIGGAIFGLLGDRFGRKPVLIATLALMGCSTLAIGLLPSHSSIGIAAPLLLVVCRVLQGLSLGPPQSSRPVRGAGQHRRRVGAAAGQPRVPDGLRSARGGVPVLGMADPVLAERGPARGVLRGADADQREPRVHPRRRSGSDQAGTAA